jgi:hypothetical protein
MAANVVGHHQLLAANITWCDGAELRRRLAEYVLCSTEKSYKLHGIVLGKFAKGKVAK